MKIRTTVIWCALNPKGQVWATWYKGCSQSFKNWRKAVLNINDHCTIKPFNLVKKYNVKY